jgi:S1-C subfamily serine protease
MAENKPNPLVSCSPFALVAILFAVALWVGWRLARPLIDDVHDPKAVARPVAARGDLAEDEKTTIDIFKRASPAVVHITTLERRLVRDRFTLRPLDIPQGTGSGFVWDERGYVVTNLHVISDANRVEVTLDDETTWEGRLVGFEPDYDIAVLKIDAPKDKLHAIAVGTSADLQVGQKVFAIGNPFGLDHTLSTGVISGLNREITATNQRTIRGVVQTDAAINPGNSGGPLLDSSGRLIGMNTAIASPTNASAGVGFAVPVDTINGVVPGLMRKGLSTRPVLGVLQAPEQYARAVRVKGFVIGTVQPGSGAEKAGLRSLDLDGNGRLVADVITAVAGQKVSTQAELWSVLDDYKAGDVVKVEIDRGGTTLVVEVTLQQGA